MVMRRAVLAPKIYIGALYEEEFVFLDNNIYLMQFDHRLDYPRGRRDIIIKNIMQQKEQNNASTFIEIWIKVS